MIMMEKYTYNLEDLVQERTDQLVEEKKKTEALLHRVLPKSVNLTKDVYSTHADEQPVHQGYMVKFYAPWCGHC